MKNAKKILALLLCAVLLVGASVAGTVAYLTSQDTVTNTFTVGSVAITLDEAKVTEYGVVDGTTRVKTNEYKLIPGHEYTKDPIVHVAKGSEQCYLFVEVVNGLANIEAATTDAPAIVTQMAAKDWTNLSGNVYYYNSVVDARKATDDVDVAVFDEFTLKGDAVVADYANASITIKAYAVQADGFGTAQAAWTATFGAPATEG